MTKFIKLFSVSAGALLFALSLTSSAQSESAVERLERFFEEDNTMFAEFVQVVLDEGLHVLEESSGLVWIQRPNLFRWEYVSPFEQTIVNDGTKTWVYDVELSQVTVSDSESFVGNTPAQILSGMGTIEENYNVEDLGRQGVLIWVAIEPKIADESQFSELRMAFDSNRLQIVEMVDGIGNTTRIQMVDLLKNPQFDERTFQFEVPDGVDVVESQ